MMAVVEKFEGRMSANIKNTGIQSGRMELLNVISLSFIFDIYLATYTISTTDAKVDV
jgi:hypothetical protein